MRGIEAHRDALVDDRPQRALKEILRFAHMHVDPQLVASAAFLVPDRGEAEHLRMQRAEVKRRPLERHAGGDEPRHQAVEQLGEACAACIARHQPVLR
jgi:hypothetical protein